MSLARYIGGFIKSTPWWVKVPFSAIPFSLLVMFTYFDYLGLERLNLQWGHGEVIKIKPVTRTSLLFVEILGDQGEIDFIVNPSQVERKRILQLRGETVQYGYDNNLRWSAGTILNRTEILLLYLRPVNLNSPIMDIRIEDFVYLPRIARISTLVLGCNVVICIASVLIWLIFRRKHNGL